MTYEQWFAQGERDSYTDRARGITPRVETPDSTEGRGYWDGYTARNPAWSAQSPRRAPVVALPYREAA